MNTRIVLIAGIVSLLLTGHSFAETELPLRIEAETKTALVPACAAFAPWSAEHKRVLSGGDWLTYVQEAPVVYRDTTSRADLIKLKGGTLDVSAGLDAAQGQYAPDSAHELATANEAFNPLDFYVGRVVRSPGGEPLQSPAAATYIHAKNKTVDSITGELQLEWDRGILKIDAPCAQAAVGFFGRVETADAVFVQDGPYGAIALVSTDGKPLHEANSMLLQVMTEEKALGFETEPCAAGERITANGRAPMILRKPAGRVQFKSADADQLTITALDHAGHPTQPVTLDKNATLTLLPNTLYYRVERKR